MCCYYNAREIPFPVVECNEYDDKRNPSLRDMSENCYILEPSKKQAGFTGDSRWIKTQPKHKTGDEYIPTEAPDGKR